MKATALLRSSSLLDARSAKVLRVLASATRMTEWTWESEQRIFQQCGCIVGNGRVSYGNNPWEHVGNMFKNTK